MIKRAKKTTRRRKKTTGFKIDHSSTTTIQNKGTSQKTVSMLEHIVDKEIAESIGRYCSTAKDNIHCQKSILGVSMAESSLFKRCYENNCFGLLYRDNDGYKVRPYKSIDASIKDWVERYNKYWYGLNNASDWLNKARYCTHGCEYWAKNYNHGLSLLDSIT